MGNKCCAAEEVAGTQKDIAEAQRSAAAKAPDVEEAVAATGGAPVSKKIGTTEWTVTLKKKEGTRLGVDVDVTDGITLQIDTVTAGLLQDWNDANPDKAVKKLDRIISVNGHRGDATKLTDTCKNDDVLELLVRRGDF
mmetsp:Transcript_84262/g.212473  ORF Transcript_84262/g.212473 Transcript_84262/m.212473 type:complete len:138 (+) Transcript_84262:127-540(+)